MSSENFSKESIGVLETRLHASIGIAERLIDSWVPASDDPSASINTIFHSNDQQLKGRPPRLGLGASFISQADAAGFITKETFEKKLKANLTSNTSLTKLDPDEDVQADFNDDHEITKKTKRGLDLDEDDQDSENSKFSSLKRKTLFRSHISNKPKRNIINPFSSMPSANSITPLSKKKKRNKSK